MEMVLLKLSPSQDFFLKILNQYYNLLNTHFNLNLSIL